MPSSKNRFRHFDTVFTSAPTSQAITTFSTPSPAASTIRARCTSRCGAVRLRTTASRRSRSSTLRTITHGLCLDITPPTPTRPPSGLPPTATARLHPCNSADDHLGVAIPIPYQDCPNPSASISSTSRAVRPDVDAPIPTNANLRFTGFGSLWCSPSRSASSSMSAPLARGPICRSPSASTPERRAVDLHQQISVPTAACRCWPDFVGSCMS